MPMGNQFEIIRTYAVERADKGLKGLSGIILTERRVPVICI
jgi:hypothetical protein